MLPINRNVKDPFYRYKMPPVETVVESNKTLIKNIESVSKSFHRDPNHLLKFLSISFGCNAKTGLNGKYFLTGTFVTKKIQTGIYDFIDEFVLCPQCSNPETKFIIQEQLLKRSCNGCGAVVTQPQHRMNALFLKDIDNDKYADKNYDDGKKAFKYEGEDQNQLFEKYQSTGTAFDALFNEMISYKNLSAYSLIFKEAKFEEILLNIENMLENNKNEENTKKYLKSLIKMGYSIEEIEKYFSRPKKDKPRNSLIKKNAKVFIMNFED